MTGGSAASRDVAAAERLLPRQFDHGHRGDDQRGARDGEDVLLEPGAYSVTAPLTVPNANEVIFGLGEATVTASANTRR